MPFAANIYYQAHQTGMNPPVILLHGAGGSHLSWPPVLRRLDGFSVFTLDLPGHGKSVDSRQQSIERYVEAIHAWMQSVSLQRAVFVGHSMGGAVAQLLCLDAPEQVIGLCLFGAAARLAVNPKLLAAAGSPTTFDRAVEDIVAWSFSRDANSRLKELVSRRLAETHPDVLRGDLLACDGFDLTGRVSDINCPTLVVCGAEDRMTPVHHSQFLADHIPHARLEVVPGAGHMVMLEKPEAATEVLAKFLVGLESD